MKDGLQGISHDRLLMRAVNYLQIIGGIFALIGGALTCLWTVHKLLEKADKIIETVHQHDQTIVHLVKKVEDISDGQQEMERRFVAFQERLHSKGGGWVWQDGQWRWSGNEKK